MFWLAGKLLSPLRAWLLPSFDKFFLEDLGQRMCDSPHRLEIRRVILVLALSRQCIPYRFELCIDTRLRLQHSTREIEQHDVRA